jgi:hypothetical protein
VHRDSEGVLAPGAPATFAVWSVPDGLSADGLPLLAPDSTLPRCRRTVLRGTTLYEEPAPLYEDPVPLEEPAW